MDWFPLDGYPGYSANRSGQIRSERRNKVLAIGINKSKHRYVCMTLDGEQTTRALSKIIAETFVLNPRPRQFNTPIHLDGNLANCHADNLAWRPRWFAMKYTQQFYADLPDTRAVRERDTGEEFENLWAPVMKYGLLYMDLMRAINNRTVTFPTMQMFEWVE